MDKSGVKMDKSGVEMDKSIFYPGSDLGFNPGLLIRTAGHSIMILMDTGYITFFKIINKSN
jgi:hypothetical protein